MVTERTCLPIRRSQQLLLFSSCSIVHATVLVVLMFRQFQTSAFFDSLAQQVTVPLNSTTDAPVSIPKGIYFYNSFWHWTDFHIGLGEEPFSQCHIKSCFTVSKTMLQSNPTAYNMSNFDAIIFHGVGFHPNLHEHQSIVSWRRPHQHFVFFMMEPPPNGPNFTSDVYNNFWNFTMTYRLDSDIVRPYSFIEQNDISDGSSHEEHKDDDYPRAIPPGHSNWPVAYDEGDFVKNVLPNKDENFWKLAKRNKTIAWVVSRCYSESRREEYVKELKKYIDVDVFGKCGMECKSNSCFEQIQQNYKFYLSFENNFARDYVTEKFFQRMQDNLIPIVLGQANYSRIAPPHSYVDVFHYDSPKELANYLHQLDKNDTEYLTFFWWKDFYHVSNQSIMHLSFCDLCAKLHGKTRQRQQMSYPHFGQWWHTDGQVGGKLSSLLSMIRTD